MVSSVRMYSRTSLVRMGVVVIFVVCFAMLFSSISFAGTYTVSTIKELKTVLGNATSGDEVLLQDGIYPLRKGWAIQIDQEGIVVRSKSGKRENVVVEGRGMYGQGHHGFFIKADGVTLADLTIQSVRNHCVQTAPGVNGLRLKNCILRDAGQQVVKVPGGHGLSPSEGGVIEGCLFEYTEGIGPRYYIGGIDVHHGKDWIVKGNVFKGIRSPGEKMAEHAIHFWSNSQNTLVEQNLIINCDRGIGFGLGRRGHSGGIIRNNMIYHDGSPGFNDVGIGLESSPDTKIYYNSILLEHEYSSAIECRFPTTTNVSIFNNLMNKNIKMRNDAHANVMDNVIDVNEP